MQRTRGFKCAVGYAEHPNTVHSPSLSEVMEPQDAFGVQARSSDVDGFAGQEQLLDGCFSQPSKVIRILEACKDVASFHLLTALATSNSGLVDDEVRRLACRIMVRDPQRPNLLIGVGPVLLGYDVRGNMQENHRAKHWRDLPPHRDEGQVQLDVNRSFIYYPKGA